MQEKPTLKSTGVALLYLAPMLLVLGTFNLYPIVKSLLMSFYTDYDFFNNEVYAYGIDNFVTLFKDPDFWLALKNTFTYVLFVVPVSMTISLGVAYMLTQIKTLSTFFRTIYFLPFVTSTVAISIVFRWIYNGNFGLMNYFLSLVGIDPIAWLTSPKYAMSAMIIMAIWRGLGFNIILFLVGLNNIDQSYYQAAKIDGAKAWQRFTNVTLPLLSPTTFLISIIGVINAFKVFDEVYALFNAQPGPLKSTMTVVFYLYSKFYQEFKYGLAAAAGIVLFVIILIFSLVQMWGSKKLVKV
ncbi:carbohydrate ABC transporter permease [Atopobacter phocae]|uniref:carbohydrate ABC transporter permease n=1 Tax=Atopobacter phocae TaxID=136492 RepID=UPI00047100E4|nr:sugar ABC transporter permease [Atopobacter phocae]